MEEKERFEFGQRTLFDSGEEVTTFDGFNLDDFMQIICKLLNQQDKQIKELEEENLSLQEQSIRDNQNWIEETTQLKQQLHDLPKKIVEEIEKNFTEYLPLKDKTGAGFYCRLNAILKKYGGEDESNND